MQRLTRLLLACAVLTPFLGVRAIRAQTVSVSGNPGLLRVSTAIAGSEPFAVSNSTTTYTVTTGNPNRLHKVTVQLNAAMPVGLTLTADLAPPPDATSLGPIAIDMTARDVVTAIPRRTDSTQSITWTLTASVTAGVVPSSSRIVTFTIVQAP